MTPEESAVRRAEPLPVRTTRTTRDGRVRPVRRHSVQWPMVLWLTLVWWLLWGTWSLLSLVGGVLVAVVASLVFPLPPLRMRVRIRPVGVVVLVARFLLDVVVASAQVARTVLPLTSATIVINGVQGTYLHWRGIAQRPGGWTRYNMEAGPPMFAPLLASLVGGMGLVAAVLRRERFARP